MTLDLAVLGIALVAGLVGLDVTLRPDVFRPVAEGAACSLAAAPGGADRPRAATPTDPRWWR